MTWRRNQSKAAKANKKPQPAKQPYAVGNPVGKKGAFIDERLKANKIQQGYIPEDADAKKKKNNKIRTHTRRLANENKKHYLLGTQKMIKGATVIGERPKDDSFVVDPKMTKDAPITKKMLEGDKYVTIDGNELRVLDHSTKALIGRDSKGNIIFIRSFREDAYKINREVYKTKFGAALQQAHRIQPNQERGKKREGKSKKKYVAVGYHKRQNGRDVIPYATTKNKTHNYAGQSAKVYEAMTELAGHVEQVMGSYNMPDEHIATQKLNVEHGMETCKLTGKDGDFAAVIIAQDYCSPVHVDSDISRSVVSVYNERLLDANSEEILQLFCFLSFGVAVALRNRDMLNFHSAFPHCAATPRHKDTFIFSFFTNNNTGLCAMAQHTENLNKKKAAHSKPVEMEDDSSEMDDDSSSMEDDDSDYMPATKKGRVAKKQRMN